MIDVTGTVVLPVLTLEVPLFAAVVTQQDPVAAQEMDVCAKIGVPAPVATLAVQALENVHPIILRYTPLELVQEWRASFLFVSAPVTDTIAAVGRLCTCRKQC